MNLTRDLKNEPVRKLSLRDAVAIGSTTTLGEAVAAMRGAHLGCAVIVDDAHRPTAMFTERGLAEYLFEYFPQQVAVQRLGNAPWMHAREGA